MAYEPINWQTGDIITSARLNRMDRGWDVVKTELFSETVITADAGHGAPEAQLVYSNIINANSLTVVLDGAEYVCPCIDLDDKHYDGQYCYGGFDLNRKSPDFTTYPFFIWSTASMNMLFTETAGEHTVAVAVSSFQTSTDFDSAVSSVFGTSPIPFRCISGQTKYSAMMNAQNAGRLMYFQYKQKTYFIHRILDTTETAVEFFPEDTVVRIKFVNDVFTVSGLQ